MIRSSLNIIDGLLTFSAGGTILQFNKEGKVVTNIKLENTFLYGTISKKHSHLIAMGRKYDKDSNCSNLYLYGLTKSNNCVYEVNLGQSHVISSDTSGFVLIDNSIVINSSSNIA